MGCVWSFFLCHACSAIEGCEGVTVNKRCEIHIDSSLEDSRIVAVLGHEFVHALLTHANNEMIVGLFGCADTDVTAAQERVAVYLGPQLMDGLQRAGILKLPKMPK
jgi:hypothetical protein